MPGVRREDPRRQHRRGRRASKLRDGRALVRLDIDDDEQVPVARQGHIRPKTLFGEKFVDIDPGDRRGRRPVPRPTSGDHRGRRSAASSSSGCCRRLSDPAGGRPRRAGRRSSSDAGRRPATAWARRSTARSSTSHKVAERQQAPTRRRAGQFLDDLALLVGRAGRPRRRPGRRRRDLNETLPELNARGDAAGDRARPGRPPVGDLADLLEANRPFLDKAITEGGKTLQLLFDERGQHPAAGHAASASSSRCSVRGRADPARRRHPPGRGQGHPRRRACLSAATVDGAARCSEGSRRPARTVRRGAGRRPPTDAAAAPATDRWSARRITEPRRGARSDDADAEHDRAAHRLRPRVPGSSPATWPSPSATSSCSRTRTSSAATFDDVTGLLPNDNVKIAGVVVGKVTGIRLEHGRARRRRSGRQRRLEVPSDSRPPSGGATCSASATSTSTRATRRRRCSDGDHDRRDPRRSSTSASCSTGSARSSRPSTRSRSTPSSTRSSRALDGNEDERPRRPSTTWPR